MTGSRLLSTYPAAVGWCWDPTHQSTKRGIGSPDRELNADAAAAAAPDRHELKREENQNRNHPRQEGNRPTGQTIEETSCPLAYITSLCRQKAATRQRVIEMIDLVNMLEEFWSSFLRWSMAMPVEDAALQ